MVNKDCV